MMDDEVAALVVDNGSGMCKVSADCEIRREIYFKFGFWNKFLPNF